MYPRHWAKLSPDKHAVIDSVTGASLTHAELDGQSNQLAQLMYAHGLRRGDHCAILMENDIRYFVMVWAALRSGLYITTVNSHLTNDEAAYIIDNSESRIVITSGKQLGDSNDLPERCPKVERWLMMGDSEHVVHPYEHYDDALKAHPAAPLSEEPMGGMMLYSSGTTGRPKGIVKVLPDQSISGYGVGALQREIWGFDENTVYLSPAPLYHSAPIGFAIAAQASGGTVIMMQRFDARNALAAIEQFHVTHSQWVPTMFSRMLKLNETEQQRFDLTSHQVAIHAAAPCPLGVKQQMLKWWGPIIYEFYGGTEGNGLTHVTPENWLAKPGTVGQAILGELHICDEEGKELPTGESGLVYFELPELPFRYLNDDEKTRSAQHPKHPNWSALGDVGHVDEDGFLFLTDRATYMIISGGVNIYPQEIEDVIIMHPKVQDVAVFGVPNEEMGEEVKAVVQLIPGVRALDTVAQEILAYTREHIAHYKCPHSIDFENELPRLPTGKLYKRILKDRYWGLSTAVNFTSSANFLFIPHIKQLLTISCGFNLS
jgi:long-chain acyl-CoA synthetase